MPFRLDGAILHCQAGPPEKPSPTHPLDTFSAIVCMSMDDIAAYNVLLCHSRPPLLMPGGFGSGRTALLPKRSVFAATWQMPNASLQVFASRSFALGGAASNRFRPLPSADLDRRGHRETNGQHQVRLGRGQHRSLTGISSLGVVLHLHQCRSSQATHRHQCTSRTHLLIALLKLVAHP